MVGIDAAIRELKARRDALTDELRKIDQALEVLAGLGGKQVPARKPGKWRPGGRGRPPKAYVEKHGAPVRNVYAAAIAAYWSRRPFVR